MALLSLRDVTHTFGGPPLLDRVNLQIEQGERVCLLGRNGEGKSTLLKLLRGDIACDEGEIIRRQGLRVARLPQEVPSGTGKTVAQEVAEGLDDGQGHRGSDSDHRVHAIISKIGLDPDAPFDQLSSGMKRRTILAQSLVSEPDILLLDEPTNHLDIDSIRWLEEFLPRTAVTLVFVTHDRAFLEKLATRIVELDRGQLYDWACDYRTFLTRKEDLLAGEERQNALFDKRLAQEEVWIRKGIEARRTRNEGRVRALKAMRAQRQTRRERQGVAKIQAQEAERSGALVVEAKNASFSYGGRTVIQGLDLTVMRGDKIGIIGPNGAGKTTLIKLLLGELSPSTGSIRQGTNLEIAFFDQLKAALDDEQTVQRNVTEYETVTIDGVQRHIIGYLQDFLFPPERSRSLVKFLSGGERSRLLLARMFTKPSNLLVLDEPTNDLDIETLELLESLLVNYTGTVLLVSHDRAFLNDVVTSILAIDSDGTVREFDGGYDDYLEQVASRAKSEPRAEAEQPKAVTKDKTKKLGFKEKKELDELPARIERLEIERSALVDQMSDPSFYRKPNGEIAEVNARLAAIEADLAAAYVRWEELEDRSS